MSTQLTIKPIAGFKALDGCHDVTSSFNPKDHNQEINQHA